MLACLQRRQNQLTSQHHACAAKIPDTFIRRKSELSCGSRPPSAAELDAYAQKTADSPLSIKIFPSNVRVPQHKQISRTVNGLDTTGQRFSPYSHSYSGGYRGLLAIVRTPAVTKGALKASDGKRTKLSPIQMAVAPYSSTAHRPRQRPYDAGLCKAPEVPNVSAPPHVVLGAVCVGLAPESGRPAHGIVQQVSRPSNAHSSPSFLAATATSCSDSGFSMSGAPHSSLPYSAAVLPTQSADVAKAAGYVEGLDYSGWQHKRPGAQQHFQQSLRVYGANGGNAALISRSPDVCVPYRSHAGSAGAGLAGGVLEKVSSSPLNCTSVHGEFSVGQFFAHPWSSVLATPDSDCYQQELPPGASAGRTCDPGLGRSHLHPHGHVTPQAYGAERALGLGVCCRLSGKSACQASLLSSSLQSLESLISEIHPPCIKERMLGRGYDATGLPHLLDPQTAHIQLPVLR